MPKPNLPPHAGPYQPAYNHSSGNSASANGDSSAAQPIMDQKQSVPPHAPTISQNHQDERESIFVKYASNPARMVWAALAFLGLGLIFAIYAIIHHG